MPAADQTDVQTAPVRPGPVVTVARVTAVLAGLAAFGLVLFIGAVVFVMTSGVFHGNAFPVDFTAFWAAGRLALEGRALDAFDQKAIVAAVTFPPEYPQQRFFWMYPPTWAAVTAPLGAVPFWVAWPVFALGSVLAYMLALRRWAGEMPGRLNLVMAAPVLLVGAVNGNTGLLMAALLVLALSGMAQGRPMAAGLLIAAMTVKPTMGLLIPFALAGGGHWRVVLWAVIGTVVFAALATIPFGIAYWERFLAGISVAADQLATGEIPVAVMVSWYAFCRAVGVAHEVAIPVQVVASVLLAALVAWGWWRRAALAEKGALLLIAAPMATPYAHYYEMAFTLAGIVLWVHAGHGRRWDERVVMALLWALPALVVFVRDPAVVPMLAAPLATLMLAMVAWRSRG